MKYEAVGQIGQVHSGSTCSVISLQMNYGSVTFLFFHPAAPFQLELLGEHFWMGRRL